MRFWTRQFSTQVVLALVVIAFSGCAGYNTVVADSAEATHPLKVGKRAPGPMLHGVDGNPFDLAAAFADKPTALIFYRGGWCMYCNRQLGDLQQIEPELVRLGYQLIGVSPDRPEKLRESIGKHKVSYRLLSDSKMKASTAYGLTFRLDDETVTKYKGYGIDLVDATGETHNQLPVPAVYLIDMNGVVQFQYANPDYTKRLDANELLDAARSAK